jgi:hypothetical protein
MEGYYLLEEGEKNTVSPIKMFETPEELKIFASPLGWKVFSELLTPKCPMDVARELGVHEQKVYYYINKFKSSNLIREVRKEQRHGTVAKFYQVRNNVFGLRVGESPKKEIRISSPGYMKGLQPFVKDGKLNSRIIVGSPDPHGPLKARASDSCCAIDLALFIGSFTDGKGIPNYKLDTDVRDSDLQGNLILIGGPNVNMVTKSVNDKLPVFIDLENSIRVVSRVSSKEYTDDACGMIVITANPYDKEGKVLILAGNRFQGTRAAIISFINKFDKIIKGNKFDRKVKARVVKGYDMDGDGVIDSGEILE